jgi:hypothetical protein
MWGEVKALFWEQPTGWPVVIVGSSSPGTLMQQGWVCSWRAGKPLLPMALWPKWMPADAPVHAYIAT